MGRARSLILRPETKPCCAAPPTSKRQELAWFQGRLRDSELRSTAAAHSGGLGAAIARYDLPLPPETDGRDYGRQQ